MLYPHPTNPAGLSAPLGNTDLHPSLDGSSTPSQAELSRSIMLNALLLGHITAHPFGGLSANEEANRLFIGGGAKRITLPSGGILWLWMTGGAKRRKPTIVVIGWPEGQGYRLYPDVLWRPGDVHPTPSWTDFNDAPWRAQLNTPAARVTFDRQAASLGEGYLPWWSLSPANPCTLPPMLTPLWDVGFHLCLAHALDVPNTSGIAIRATLDRCLIEGQRYLWKRTLLRSRVSGSVPHRLELTLLDALDPVEAWLTAFAHTPGSVLQPVHAAGHQPLSNSKGLPAFINVILGEQPNHTILAAKRTQQQMRTDPQGLIAQTIAACRALHNDRS